MRRHADCFNGLDFHKAVSIFRETYRSYNPAKGMADYVRINWHKYGARN